MPLGHPAARILPSRSKDSEEIRPPAAAMEIMVAWVHTDEIRIHLKR